MGNSYRKYTKAYDELALKTLKEFVAIDSTYDESTASKENPFGEGVSKALQYFAEVALKDGFTVTNYDNMIVEACVGEGDKNITIMAHADVVPAGTGWDQNPFEMVVKDGVLHGRGVADDKGPLVACYYGLKALKDNGLLGNYKVRFLVGGNEESGSLCMEHYFKTLKKPQPTFGFSPDADYPLIFAEKAIMGFEIKKDMHINGVKSIRGGVASNAVIEKCDVVLEDEMAKKFYHHLKEKDIEIAVDGNMISFIGKAAHGATPEQGKNAGMIALTELAEFLNDKDLKVIVKGYTNLKGEGVNAGGYSKEMGNNSLNVGLLDYENDKFSMIVNFRYVETCSREQLINNIKEASKPFEFVLKGEAPMLFYPKDSVLVSTLLKVYQEEYDDYKTEPLAIGGGTYAKEAENTIAFGMQVPGWDAKMHSPGEQLKVEDLIKGMEVYAHAIIELGKKL